MNGSTIMFIAGLVVCLLILSIAGVYGNMRRIEEQAVARYRVFMADCESDPQMTRHLCDRLYDARR